MQSKDQAEFIDQADFTVTGHKVLHYRIDNKINRYQTAIIKLSISTTWGTDIRQKLKLQILHVP